MSIGKIIVIAFVAISAIVFAIRMIYGYRKGMAKAIMSFVCVLLAALLTFLLASPLSNLVSNINISGFGLEVDGRQVSTAEEAAVYAVEGLGGENGLGKALMQNESIAAGVKKAPSLAASIIIGPLFFLLAYLVLRLITVFAGDALLRLITRRPEQKPNSTSKYVGLGVGFVSAFVFCGVLFMTVLGVVSITKDSAADVPVLGEIATDFGDSAVAKVYSAFGFDSLGKSYMNAASSYETEGENGKTVYLADELSSAVKIYSELNSRGVFENKGGENSSGAGKILADPELVYSVTDAIKGSDLLKEALPTAAKYMMTGPSENGAESSAVSKIENITDEDIDDLVAVYGIMDESGLAKAIAENDSEKLREILSDGDTADKLAGAVKDSEVAKAVVTDAVSETLTDQIVSSLAESDWEGFDLDKLISQFDKSTLDNLYDHPEQTAVTALVGNEKLNEFIKNYDRDAEDVDRAELKAVVESIMEQYGIDGDELYEQAQALRDAATRS